MRRNVFFLAVSLLSLSVAFAWLVPSMAQEEKKAEKAAKKAEKASGDVGLLDTEKNYMILVTKEGKLLTFDFDQKTKVTKTETSDTKMGEVGLGSSATIEYQVGEDKALDSKIKAAEEELARLRNEQKKVATGLNFVPAKGE